MRLEWDAAVRRDCARMNPSGRAGRGATVPDRQGQVPGPPRPLDRDRRIRAENRHAVLQK